VIDEMIKDEGVETIERTLPPPEGPTSATSSPGSIVKL
jgi:hypothetical protein